MPFHVHVNLKIRILDKFTGPEVICGALCFIKAVFRRALHFLSQRVFDTAKLLELRLLKLDVIFL